MCAPKKHRATKYFILCTYGFISSFLEKKEIHFEWHERDQVCARALVELMSSGLHGGGKVHLDGQPSASIVWSHRISLPHQPGTWHPRWQPGMPP
uniref:Uncharacterized protein n=1 Tax=Arundo donax TaxID=35708 RepID=A0A0A9BSK1_ARUDO